MAWGGWDFFLADAYWQEMLNYWKQLPHVLKYFRADESTQPKMPGNFMTGFLEVSLFQASDHPLTDLRDGIEEWFPGGVDAL
jgi:hypothetical protein